MKNSALLFAGLLTSSFLYGQIIFTRQVNNNDNLLLIDASGKTRTLTSHARKDSSPRVSPDGKSIIFTSERKGWWKIWKMDLTNNAFTQLTFSGQAEYSPDWSPDGNHIVFVSSRDGNEEIYIMDNEGQGLRNLTRSTTSDLHPFWASDHYIYYSTQINGVYQLAKIKPDGASRQILTSGPGNKMMPQVSGQLDKILFYGDRSGNDDIYILEVASRKINRLTNSPLTDRRPRWSEDYSLIVFERGNRGNNHHVFTMDNLGQNQTQRTFSGYNYAPSFVPSNSVLLQQ